MAAGEVAAQTLKGKVALVTGAGSGLGAAIACVLGESGARGILADVRGDAVERQALAIVEHGGEAVARRLDVTDERQVEETVLDVLVNCAGVDVTLPVDELAVADWDRIIAVNLRGPYLLSRCALPAMKQRGDGAIVNIISTAAKRAWPNAAAYHASKWGLLGFSHALHTEARPFGVKVTAIISGGMRTPFLLDRFPDLDPGNLQDPFTVARTVLFALSLPTESVIPELMVLPLRETSWP
jgi:NAD(P)-dependent dehydrogenase (short-subunit alcohol dehydrogenase family)